MCFLLKHLLSLANPSFCWEHIGWLVANRNTTTPVKALNPTNCYFAELRPPWMGHPRNGKQSATLSIIHLVEQLIECSSFQICPNGFGFCVLLRDRMKDFTASTMSNCVNQLVASWQGKFASSSKYVSNISRFKQAALNRKSYNDRLRFCSHGILINTFFGWLIV